jgi:hypothetical protein
MEMNRLLTIVNNELLNDKLMIEQQIEDLINKESPTYDDNAFKGKIQNIKTLISRLSANEASIIKLQTMTLK